MSEYTALIAPIRCGDQWLIGFLRHNSHGPYAVPVFTHDAQTALAMCQTPIPSGAA